MAKNKIAGYELRTAIAKVIPNYSLDEDNDGQIIIYTNLKEIDNDFYIEFEEGERE